MAKPECYSELFPVAVNFVWSGYVGYLCWSSNKYSDIPFQATQNTLNVDLFSLVVAEVFCRAVSLVNVLDYQIQGCARWNGQINVRLKVCRSYWQKGHYFGPAVLVWLKCLCVRQMSQSSLWMYCALFRIQSVHTVEGCWQFRGCDDCSERCNLFFPRSLPKICLRGWIVIGQGGMVLNWDRGGLG